MVKCCVLFAVRTELLNIIQTIFGFKGLIFQGGWGKIPVPTGPEAVLVQNPAVKKKISGFPTIRTTVVQPLPYAD
jgi:hypothetical protein